MIPGWFHQLHHISHREFRQSTSVIDSITARVIQAMHSDIQTSTPLTTVNPESPAEGPDSDEVVSNVIQSLFSGETGELPSDIPKPYTSVSHPLGASLPLAVKK